MTQALKNINKALQKNNVGPELLQGRFGIEKENVRVLTKGELSLSPHPKLLGDKNTHPYITTDFSESQVEMITPPLDSIRETHGFLETIHDIVTENIGDELLWPQSLPPIISKNIDIPIARYGEKGKDKETYREMLARIYGKERQLISGVHFNFSFSDELLEKLKTALEFKGNNESFKEQVYFKLSRNILRYRWVLIWLFGASPKSEDNYQVKSLLNGTYEGIHCKKGVSLRNCKSGYRNKEDFYLDFSNTKTYQESIGMLIKQGRLKFDKELYAPVRIKFNDDKQYISHIELRIMDLNPLEKSGVSINELYFIHLFIVYCLLKDEDKQFTFDEQYVANMNHDRVSCCGRHDELLLNKFDGREISQVDWANEIIAEIKEVAVTFDLFSKPEYQQAFDDVFYLAKNPEKRIVYEIMKRNNELGFVNSNLELAQQYKKESLSKGYRFYGREDMELSTQLVLKEAVLRGLKMEILDRTKNFISLSNAKKTEYIMQATKTSVDNYSSILLMEDKQITKKILSQNNINVPRGKQYASIDKALEDFQWFRNQPVVIKPNSTNFGIGISILKENKDEGLYKRAVEIAFEQDSRILIEHFFTGDEYRFFVIGDNVEGILKRIPANVSGNGSFSIRELVALKNQDPIRGKGYRTPLEKISLGEAEAMFLKTQGMDFESIPQKDQTVYLRENSNISTGGDSIDFTDEMHHSYKKIAVAAAKALKVNISGLDMVVQDITVPATDTNYSIIELNFNPAIHIHCFPFVGKNRSLNKKILDVLGLYYD